jgi:hypothetical protein
MGMSTTGASLPGKAAVLYGERVQGSQNTCQRLCGVPWRGDSLDLDWLAIDWDRCVFCWMICTDGCDVFSMLMPPLLKNDSIMDLVTRLLAVPWRLIDNHLMP